LLCGSVIFNYGAKVIITNRKSIYILIFAIISNISLLFYYKYANFFLGISSASSFSIANTVLPLAISFFTFQQIAYLYDVYVDKAINHSLLEYTLFVVFFPQLIAGPIVSQAEILPQLKKHNALRPRGIDIAVGITIFSLGLFKKVVIADTMATFATPVFDGAAMGNEITFLAAWTGALSFTFQLYFDFSGYSDMAVGLARLFGIHLPLNFNSPYKALNIIDFWRRWHITLSRFLRDFLYIPLGGGRVGMVRRQINLMIVMILGGLWHGAGVTFILWGGLHGLFLVINHLWRAFLKRYEWSLAFNTLSYRVAAWLVTFTVVVFAWVLFRAQSLQVAQEIYRAMLGFNGIQLPDRLLALLGPIPGILAQLGIQAKPLAEFKLWNPHSAIWIAVLTVAVLTLPHPAEWCAKYVRNEGVLLRHLSKIQRWRPTLPYAAFVIVLLIYTTFQINGSPTEFLYFQF